MTPVLASQPVTYATERGAGYHYGRIRALMDTGWSDAIVMDLGVPHYSYPALEDGHHRLIAAYYRGDKTILAECSGWVAAADWLRGKRKSDPWARF